MQSLFYAMLGLATTLGCFLIGHSWDLSMVFSWRLEGALRLRAGLEREGALESERSAFAEPLRSLPLGLHS